MAEEISLHGCVEPNPNILLHANKVNVSMQSTVIPPMYYSERRKGRECFRTIADSLKAKIAGEIKALLHAHRDTLRNIGRYDTRHVTFVVTCGYYGEAFGIMRTLNILGYGYFGSSNINGIDEIKSYVESYEEFALHNPNRQKEHNLRWWFDSLSHEVLEEEGYFNKSYVCEYCFNRYHKDTARMRHTQGKPADSNKSLIEDRLSEIVSDGISNNKIGIDPDRIRYMDS